MAPLLFLTGTTICLFKAMLSPTLANRRKPALHKMKSEVNLIFYEKMTNNLHEAIISAANDSAEAVLGGGSELGDWLSLKKGLR